MAIVTLDDMCAHQGALIGIDPGSKTYGLAISDTTRLIATPLHTIRRKKFSKDAQSIFEAYDTHNCVGMIVGYPINMDGTEGPRCQSVRDFVTNLLEKRDVPILLWDERLSTAAVTRTMLEADISRAKRAENVDKLAAAYLLQGLLDRLKQA
ncbi:MAG TPA: Holliday junction resolvase RuvX [Hellea balneolensis]|uniref:Putative pre-16S rRNA nuclease n=1 Tax=Hellea balneolensis TaxID=287478 RepID=A0A7C5R1J5_9PROT|nr:Holliday junction resolvase RuvX [Hellea balneolensis]